MSYQGRSAGLRPRLADRAARASAIGPTRKNARHRAGSSQQSDWAFHQALGGARNSRRLCREHRIALIVDEVFLDYGFGAKSMRRSSFAAGLEGVDVYVVSGLSKIAGLPQMKAAWIVATGPNAGPQWSGWK